ncbi:MAG: polyphosphate polymerase domain-containing protein [Candidatus Howiella sp.]|jgi:hypothetical protein
MATYQDIFERYEKKYLLYADQYRALRPALEPHMQPDIYGRTTICNIYFDTPDHRIIRRSLEKPVYKEKLRLRSYGVPGKQDRVFIELKKKYRGIVYKRRTDMRLAQAEDYLYRGGAPGNPTQITREIDWFLHSYPGIKPAMYLSYDRIALAGRESRDLRVTFDSRILWRGEELSLSCGPYGRLLLPADCHLMEVKIPGAMPLWMARLFSELEIYPVSFSKYGGAYRTAQNKVDAEKEEIHSA